MKRARTRLKPKSAPRSEPIAMDPTEQGGAASSKPYSDLDSRLLAMRLGDPSPWRQQARLRAPTPSLLPSPQEFGPTATPAARPLLRPPPYLAQEFVPTATPSERPPLRQPPYVAQEFVPTTPPALPPPLRPPPYLAQEFVPTATSVERWPPENLPQPKPEELVRTNSLDVCLQQQVRQYWTQSRPQGLGYSGGESSAGTGLVSLVAPRPSISSSTFASLYSKHSPRFDAPAASFLPKAPKPSKLSASAEEFHPVPKPSKPSVSAEDFQPIPHSQPWRRTYSSVSQWRGCAPALDRLPRLDEIQLRPLRASRKPGSVTSAGVPERVVQLLAEHGEEVRLIVLNAVKRAVHAYMGDSEKHVVFLALLGACKGSFDELHCIVMAACTGDGSLMRVAERVYGETSLKELIRVVAPYPQLSQLIITHLLRGQLMKHCKGACLVHHCFTSLPYKDCSIIILSAISTTNEMLSSAFGTKCLVECFKHARNEELAALERFVLSNTHALAKGASSNYFLQEVLECGSMQIKEGITERIAHDIVGLSAHPNGSYVVEACIDRTCSLVPLLRLLTAFQDLDEDQLGEMVQGSSSNYVLQKLLKTCKPHFPEQTMALAWRILKLPLDVRRNLHASLVMSVAKKLFPEWMYW